MKITTEIKVRGYHIDMYGHVNNARFLEFLEDARWEWYEAIDESIKDKIKHLAFTAVNININYRAAALFNYRLLVDCECIKTSARSATLRQQVVEKHTQKLIVDAEVTFVLVDPKLGKAVSIDPQWLEALKS